MKKLTAIAVSILLALSAFAKLIDTDCQKLKTDKADSKRANVAQSYDPNEMSGPAGVGAQRYVKSGESMDYTIYFENQTNATAAAIKIAVTLPKDANLDWSTLELGEVVFGDHTDDGFVKDKTARSIAYPLAGTGCEVRTTVTESDDAVTWNLRIWDPNTTDHFPDDFNMGILPPNDPETHCGEGHITYRVKVKDDAAQGAVVRASASIVFDDNPAIETDPAWWNTVGSPGAQFAADEVVVDEGGTAEVRVSGGNADKASSVQVYLAYNTAAAADVDLKTATVADGDAAVSSKPPYQTNLKFPLTLSWAKGEIGEKVITIPVKADTTVEDDEFFTLQLANAQGMELGDATVCTVTIHDPGYDELAAKIADGTATKAEKTAWEKLQKAKAPYVRGLADPADGGKVAGSGLCAEGKKVTLKATANKNFTFLGWIDSPVAIDSVREQSTAIEFVATTASLVIDRSAKPAANSKTSTTITNVAEDVTYYAVFKSYPEVFVTVDATDDTGAEPTGKGAGKYVAGTITGMGKYAIGKTKIALKATANKDYVFSGWHNADGVLITKDATYTIAAMGEDDVEYTAKFITAEEDKASIALALAMATEAEAIGLSTNEIVGITNFCGVAMNWQLAADALSATTIKVSGLPAGIKFTAKDIVDSKTKQVTVPANTIYGAPTAASKVDARTKDVTPSKVVFTVTTAGKSTQTFAINLYIDPLPAWAVGTFDGEVGNGELGMGNGKSGTVALTVAANGKISGKVLDGGKTWALSASEFSRVDRVDGDDEFYATVIGKAGKEVVTNEVTVSAENGIGVATGIFDAQLSTPNSQLSTYTWTAYQNLWKRADTKASQPVFKKNFDVDYLFGASGDKNNTVKLTFKKDGVVGFAGKKDGVAVSGSSQLVYGENGWQVTLYAPPKPKAKPAFEGWCKTFAVTLTSDEQKIVTEAAAEELGD